MALYPAKSVRIYITWDTYKSMNDEYIAKLKLKIIAGHKIKHHVSKESITAGDLTLSPFILFSASSEM